MTASDATATIKKGNSEPSFDKTAQRILNLFFVLNSSPEPLTTEQIVLDSDLGYGSGNIDSDKRKFRRDRDKLLERGILIKEVRPAGAQETEESSWTIDREHTFAAGGLITADDADILLNAIDQTIAAGSSTFAAPLADIRSKIAYLTGMSAVDEAPIRRSPTVDAVWSAFAERCALRFLYQNGRGEQKERTVCVYGMFEREGVAYFCGLDNATDDIRTFRCDRIVRNGLTRGRGELAHTDSGWTWTVDVRDLEAAASFCMAHAMDGMRPMAPKSLKQAWNHLIERTVHEHARA